MSTSPKLNPEQRQAVRFGDGPLLVVAGAGTGKTTVLTERIVDLIDRRGVSGGQILAMTFTEEAAREMDNRIFDRLSFQRASALRVGTYHSFGRELLERFGYHLGRPGGRLVKRPEQIVLLRDHLDQLPLDLLKPRSEPARHLSGILDVISRLKNDDVSPERYHDWLSSAATAAKKLPAGERPARQAALAKHRECAGCFTAYEQLKTQYNLIDYDDQLTMPLELLRQHPDVLATVRETYRYVLLDEFQDTNVVQAELAYLVAGTNGNITAVGDDDQSIYAFRGASLSNILEFEKRHSTTTRVVLTTNYRSSQPILDASYRLIQHNNPHRLEAQNAFDKRLRAHDPAGPQPVFWQNQTIDDEADRVAELLKASHAEGTAYREMAILVSQHRDAEPFRQSLAMLGIPAAVTQRAYLYQQPEVMLAIAALRVINNPLHSSSLRMLATSPLYQFPDDDFALLEKTEARHNRPVWQQLAEPPNELTEAGRQVAAILHRDIIKFQAFAKNHSASEVAYAYLVEHRGLLTHLTADPPEGAQAIENISVFLSGVKRFCDTARDSSVAAWLEYFDHIAELSDEAVTDADFSQSADEVSIMTMHAAKGLEFELVVLPALTQSRVPGSFRPGLEPPAELLRDPLDRAAYIREQRRLCYVAITRARRQLVLSFPRSLGGKREQLPPSVFIAEALGESAALVAPARGRSAERRIHRLRAVHQAPGPYQPPDPLILNHSAAEAFRVCPWRYYWDYHVHVFLPPQPALLFGDAVHQTIRDFNQSMLDGAPLSVTATKQAFAAYWRGEGYHSAVAEEEARVAAERAVLGHRKRALREPRPAAVEQPFRFPLDSFFVNGRWDLIQTNDDRVRILDYKTSQVDDQAAADKKLRDGRNARQLALYAMAYQAEYGRLPDEVGLSFPESGLVAVRQPTLHDVDRLRDELKIIARKIIAGEFKPNPARHECSRAACNRCPANTARNRGDWQ